jgi:hypothetical protein
MHFPSTWPSAEVFVLQETKAHYAGYQENKQMNLQGFVTNGLNYWCTSEIHCWARPTWLVPTVIRSFIWWILIDRHWIVLCDCFTAELHRGAPIVPDISCVRPKRDGSWFLSSTFLKYKHFKLLGLDYLGTKIHLEKCEDFHGQYIEMYVAVDPGYSACYGCHSQACLWLNVQGLCLSYDQVAWLGPK